MKSTVVATTLLSILLPCLHAQPEQILGVTILEPDELKAGLDEGAYRVLLDVRTVEEFNAGHIDGATFAESLGLFGTGEQKATPDDLVGCKHCSIAVYCDSGARASGAIQVLLDNGFVGQMYNARGVDDWVDAGYELSNTGSVDPPCMVNKPAADECYLSYLARTNGGGEGVQDDSTKAPVAAPADMPSATKALSTLVTAVVAVGVGVLL